MRLCYRRPLLLLGLPCSLWAQQAGLTVPNTQGGYAEREVELFATGARLVDQRRFDLGFDIPGPWRYLPITENERNQNPNL